MELTENERKTYEYVRDCLQGDRGRWGECQRRSKPPPQPPETGCFNSWLSPSNNEKIFAAYVYTTCPASVKNNLRETRSNSFTP